MVGLATVESQYLEGRASLNCSDETAAAIDSEVVAIIKESYDKALELLRENRELMDKLAAFLIEKETITGKEFMEIFRREKGLPDPKEEKTAENAVGNTADAGSSFGSSLNSSLGSDSVLGQSELTEDLYSKEVKNETKVESEEEAVEPPDDDQPVGLFSHGKID